MAFVALPFIAIAAGITAYNSYNWNQHDGGQKDKLAENLLESSSKIYNTSLSLFQER